MQFFLDGGFPVVNMKLAETLNQTEYFNDISHTHWYWQELTQTIVWSSWKFRTGMLFNAQNIRIVQLRSFESDMLFKP